MKKLFLFILACCSLIFTGCGNKNETKDGITLKESQKTLYFGDEYQIHVSSVSPIEYLSENEYHAIVSKTGLVKAFFVGKTDILLSSDNKITKFKVTVEPQQNTYPDPILEFGESKDNIISRLGVPDSETENVIGYIGYSSKAPMVMYLFDDNDNLQSSCVMVGTDYSSELGKFLGERYLCISQDDLIFVNGLTEETVTMVVTASLYEGSYWMIIYGPYNNVKSTSSVILDPNIKNRIDRMYEKLIK